MSALFPVLYFCHFFHSRLTIMLLKYGNVSSRLHTSIQISNRSFHGNKATKLANWSLPVPLKDRLRESLNMILQYVNLWKYV